MGTQARTEDAAAGNARRREQSIQIAIIARTDL